MEPPLNTAAPQLTIAIKWNGVEHRIELPETATIGDIKSRLFGLTRVAPARQKITVKGRLPPDATKLSELQPLPKQMLMIGTPDEKLLVEPSPDQMPDVLNDFDYDNVTAMEEIRSSEENKRKLQSKLQEKYEISLISQPRPGKKLLVLDLDYTLFDWKIMTSETGNIAGSKRPYLDEFLAAVYKDFDICVWSQTSWRWLELKLTELGILTNPNYQISFVLDRTLMFSVTSRWANGELRTHEVKALQLIWAKLPQYYTPKNTIHIDDLSRNFALNPQNGLKILAFKGERASRTDVELVFLTKYLLKIGKLEDLSKLDHSVRFVFVDDNRLRSAQKWKQSLE